MSHKVAVYGSLKEGFGNHRLLCNATKLGNASVEGWTMLSLGGFPGIVKGEEVITTEVYEVTDEEMIALDSLEGYPSFYNRKLVSTEYGMAWIYYLNNPKRYLSYSVVESGEW